MLGGDTTSSLDALMITSSARTRTRFAHTTRTIYSGSAAANVRAAIEAFKRATSAVFVPSRPRSPGGVETPHSRPH